MKAIRTSWQTRPLPSTQTKLKFNRSFTKEEYDRIACGLIPREMEDKWFIFLEGEWLFIHRSWTGICIFGVRLLSLGEEYYIEETWVNGDSKEYKDANDTYDVRVLGFLIDRVLLGKEVFIPRNG